MKVLPTILVMLLLVSTFVMASDAETFPASIDNPYMHGESLESRRRSIDCLASNIYYEARGESKLGKIAVGLVTINRVKDPRYPDTICEVVREPKQFSWYRPGKIVRLASSGNAMYGRIRELAVTVYDTYYTSSTPDDITHGATHFHSKSVNPSWNGKVKVASIGNHVFFKVRY